MNEWIRILFHAVCEPDRNFFITDPASRDGLMCEALCAAGMMRKVAMTVHPFGGMAQYAVTDRGLSYISYERSK